MAMLLTVVALTIGVSAICSLLEAVLYSTRMGVLESATSGPRAATAKRMIVFKQNIGRPVAAILILNTIANTLGATFAGALANRIWPPPYVTAFSVALTLGILTFAEIVPKTSGAVHWRVLWPLTVWPLTVMQFVLRPLIALTTRLSDALGGDEAATVTEDEIVGAARLGAEGGEISQWESRLVQNVIRLEERTLEQVMTPRTVVVSVEESMDVATALQRAAEVGFSRIPVYSGEREQVTGYVKVHDLITVPEDQRASQTVAERLHPLPRFAETMNCRLALAEFLQRRIHIALAVDPFGGLSGIVTLEDLLETVLGAEIVDEQDRVDDLQKLAREQKPPEDAGDADRSDPEEPAR